MTLVVDGQCRSETGVSGRSPQSVGITREASEREDGRYIVDKTESVKLGSCRQY
jgi:hypothetical protein